MGERTVRESVSGDLCRPIVPERLWMILFCLSVCYGGFRDAVGYPRMGQNHSHSIILDRGRVTKQMAALTSFTSLMMRRKDRAWLCSAVRLLASR
jgi:hypothetical protein